MYHGVKFGLNVTKAKRSPSAQAANIADSDMPVTGISNSSRAAVRVRIDVEIATPDQARTALDNGSADIALAFNLRPHRDIHVIWSAELPLVCIASPEHSLTRVQETKLHDAIAYPLVLQSRALAVRKILEARYAWMLSENRPPVVTNSLQLLKNMVVAGSHIALTSELDVTQEILDGTLKAITLNDRTLTVQNISVAISLRRTLPRICRIVMDELAGDVQTILDQVRARRNRPKH